MNDPNPGDWLERLNAALRWVKAARPMIDRKKNYVAYVETEIAEKCLSKAIASEAPRTLSASFRAEVEKLINKCSMENGSDTPDFILAEYLSDCVETFDKAVTHRAYWHGHKDSTNARSQSAV